VLGFIVAQSAPNDVPKRFLEHIMLDLKEQGWVASSPGCKGGYVLARPPDQITMGRVVRYFDGLLAPIGCASVTHYEPCSQSLPAGFGGFCLRCVI
jgi:Rrf2 family protein